MLIKTQINGIIQRRNSNRTIEIALTLESNTFTEIPFKKSRNNSQHWIPKASFAIDCNPITLISFDPANGDIKFFSGSMYELITYRRRANIIRKNEIVIDEEKRRVLIESSLPKIEIEIYK